MRLEPTSIPTSPRRSRRLIAAAALTAASTLALTAPAFADSIVYIDGGNVWSASPDGTRKVQLTDGGDWHSPTQSDNGTIAAVEGASNLITVMAADGRPIRTIATAQARAGDGTTFAPRPVELSFSPDGGRIAYSYVANSCSPGVSCGTIQRSTFYTYANVTEATPQSMFGEQFSVSDAEWVTNDRTILFGGAGTAISLDDLAGGGDSSFTKWMPWMQKDVNDGEISKDGRHLAYVWDYGLNTKISIDTLSGDPRTAPFPAPSTPSCETSRDANFSDPTWSPDGLSLAFHDTDGIEILRFSAIAANSCTVAGSSILGPGAEPDWGPANPPAARYAPATPAPPAAGNGGAATTGANGAGTATTNNAGNSSKDGTPISGLPRPGAVNGPSGSVTVVSASVRRSALRRGTATLRLRVSAAGRVDVRLTSGVTTIATGHATAKAAGTVTVRLSKAGRKALAALRGRSAALVRSTLSASDTERVEGSGPVTVR
ncbi:MAG: hypothetical protein PGN13_15450 [Patulibacter minatonensis]